MGVTIAANARWRSQCPEYDRVEFRETEVSIAAGEASPEVRETRVRSVAAVHGEDQNPPKSCEQAIAKAQGFPQRNVRGETWLATEALFKSWHHAC